MVKAIEKVTTSGNEAKANGTREIVLWLMLFNAGFVFGFIIVSYLQLIAR
jgi:hypothetical protein